MASLLAKSALRWQPRKYRGTGPSMRHMSPKYPFDTDIRRNGFPSDTGFTSGSFVNTVYDDRYTMNVSKIDMASSTKCIRMSESLRLLLLATPIIATENSTL